MAAAKAKPDGYTLMLTADSSQVINPSLYEKPGFDPVKDFVLVANPAFAPNNVAELIATAKAKPGQITMA